MEHPDQSLYEVVKARIEHSLKEFFPAAGIFTAIFLLFRVYEFILLRGRLSAHADLAGLEFGSIGYDMIFSSALVAVTLILHIVISVFQPRVAYRLTKVIFIFILALNFFAVQYFVHTLQLLSIDSIEVQFSRMISSMPSELNWMTITPLLVLLPLAIAAFSEMKAYLVVHRLSFAHILAVVLVCNLSWFLPMSPPQGRFEDNMDYNLATNKTYFLFSDALRRVKPHVEVEETHIVLN